MSEYNVLAKVNQIVTKEIQLQITAGSKEEAEDFARSALMDYPRPVDIQNVRRILVNKANFWIPRDIEVVKIEKEEEAA